MHVAKTETNVYTLTADAEEMEDILTAYTNDLVQRAMSCEECAQLAEAKNLHHNAQFQREGGEELMDRARHTKQALEALRDKTPTYAPSDLIV